MTTASSSQHRTGSRSDNRAERIRDVVFELARQHSRGGHIDPESVLATYPELRPELDRELGKLQTVGDAFDRLDEDRAAQIMGRLQADWQQDPVGASDSVDAISSVNATRSVSAREGGETGQNRAAETTWIGRYRVLRKLGEGGFARVVVARDEELQREVAIKVPHRHRLVDGETAQAYLQEARIVAALDHPAIVSVYDAGRTPEGSVFVVSKLIEGNDLSKRIRQQPLDRNEAVQLLITIADAIDYAHRQGLIHRDIKPANILLDTHQRPYLADFGLALREADLEQRLSYAGTPNYMSPEQARGEAHRVDGRSDIFSLGVVLCEALTGHKLFSSGSYENLLEQIRWGEPQPLRYWDDSISPELERICLKAMAKRAADRYQSARTLIDDLQHYLEPSDRQAGSSQLEAVVIRQRDAAGHHVTAGTPSKIVPKGLRPFDANDAEGFLDLLPGPRDRNGLPETIRQWKHSIEAVTPDESFPIGLIYGPSGSGKSSLVRAGLLPCLSVRIESVYVEATSEDMAQRIMQSIGHRFPELNQTQDLVQCLIDVRRGKGPAEGEKLLIVLDQFEQWLQGKTEQQRRPLVEALRQCDGKRLACILSVRDDFWLAVSRFMAELEIDLVQGHNASLVDLFDTRHARYVLAELGRSHGRLPDDLTASDVTQQTFLQRAVQGLAQEERVVPVRLALFSEMVKDKPWTTATLRDVGGASGVGVAFLEETFSASKANPQHRLHERAARAVLGALLPEPGSNVRGRIRSYTELLEISGYGLQPRLFKDLMRILDSETRLLTPMDPAAIDISDRPLPASERYYQLTHDYLVISLREWLRTKQQSTAAGRAELRLTERSLLWNAYRERRQLPSLREWLAIRSLTRASRWTAGQKKMMRHATRYHLLNLTVLVALLLAFLFGGVEISAFARNLFLEFRARSAVVWMAVGMEDPVWNLLQRSPDPSLRTRVIHGLHPLVTNPGQIIDKLPTQNNVSLRQGMLLVIGEIGEPESLKKRRSALGQGDTLIRALLELYREDPDPGVHAAAKWVLAKYSMDREMADIDRQLHSDAPFGGRNWYVNQRGITLAVIPGPSEFSSGSAAPADAGQRDRAARQPMIPRRYYIATEEITAQQFRAFLHDHPTVATRFTRTENLAPQQPQTEVSWYDAAAFCNWLSAEAELPSDEWCYEPNSAGQYAAGMRCVAEVRDRRGYRLPTEAEWEHACRSGTVTSRHFGNDESLLANYAVSQAVSPTGPLRVGTRKPNDFGLFDIYGNVSEWCHDEGSVRSSPPERSGNNWKTIRNATPRVLRGGSYLDPASQLQSTTRESGPPPQQPAAGGFRVARSCF